MGISLTIATCWTAALTPLYPAELVAPTDGPANGVAYIYGDLLPDSASIDVDGIRTPASISSIASGILRVELVGFTRGVVSIPDVSGEADITAPFSLSGAVDDVAPVWSGPVVIKDVASDTDSFVSVTVDRPAATDDGGIALVTAGTVATSNASNVELTLQMRGADPQCVTFSAFDFGGNRTDITGCDDDNNSNAGCSAVGASPPAWLALAAMLRRMRSR
jgi:hypothetical protein